MSKRQDEIREMRNFMADYTRSLDRQVSGIHPDSLPILAFSIDKNGKSCSVARQRGDFAATEKVEVPAYHEGKPVTRIDDGAFLFNNAKEISIPQTVTHIALDDENDAFTLCGKLTKIHVHPENTRYSSRDGVLFNKDQTILLKCPGSYVSPVYAIPHGVTDIGFGAFADCKKLEEVIIPESVTEIGRAAFIRCRIQRVTIPESVKVIQHFTFYHCKNLAEVTMLHGVQKIENWSFSGCTSLTQLTIPASVEKIGGKVFISSDNLAAVYGKNIPRKPAGWSKDWNSIGTGHRIKAYWDQ